MLLMMYLIMYNNSWIGVDALGEGVLLSGSLDPLTLPETGVVCRVS